MCGIIGYAGYENGVEKVISGLSYLEYRGYDSVGLAAVQGDDVVVIKTEGRVSSLEKKLDSGMYSTIAIGHTRWATHGAPTYENAHPHKSGNVTVVHNGIIENYHELAEELKKEGVSFKSSTDTEIAAAYIDKCYKLSRDPVAAIDEAAEHFNGSYAFAIIFDDRRDRIYAVRSGSPLVIGKGVDGYYVSSDVNALLRFSQEYYTPEDNEIVELNRDGAISIGGAISAEITSWSTDNAVADSAELGGCESFMYKEMMEQPEKLIATMSPYLSGGLPTCRFANLLYDAFMSVDQIEIVACGSAMHAGLIGAMLLQEISKISTKVYIASEYRYFPPLCTDKGRTLVMLISQSGETADTLAALRYARDRGSKTFAIVNTANSSISRDADFSVHTHAGPEIAVATTKGYSTQIAILWLIATSLALSRGLIDKLTARNEIGALMTDAPAAIRSVLDKTETISDISHLISGRKSCFYIGRGVDHFISLEGALKLKEISYVYAEAHAAGELKHGTIALIEKGTPVIAVATNPNVYDKMESNIREVKARGATVILIAPSSSFAHMSCADKYIEINDASTAGKIFGAIAVVQMLAYNVAKIRGCDVDHPKNLAKSVTVE